ncbi:MAG: class A beta-lactamase-related serine hydrolase, partial [Sphingobacteriia bacterium]|nr:class A beta-lactamase-related serine hydrolase [Sphingobacteriia bacterium]
MHFFRIILLFLLVFFSCNTTTITSNEFKLTGFDGAVVPAPLSDECRTRIDSTVARYLSGIRFNGNVLVAYKGYPVARYSHGYANYYTRERLNHHTLFQLASVSKAFTAMSVLILYERGQINIYQPVQQYIPEFPFPDITIRHLLQHTSGLPNYMFYVDNYWQKDQPLHYSDVLNLLKVHGKGLGFTPGRRFHYSNTGYAMLAMIVEKVSGIPYYRFVKENIFNPLGMDRSFVW